MTDEPDGFMIPFQQFEREFITKGGKVRVSDLEWRYALDYKQMGLDKIQEFNEANRAIRSYFRGRLGSAEVNIPANDTIASYQGKKEKLDVMMLSLYSPVMLMLAFYLFMAANLVIERQNGNIRAEKP